MNPWGLNATALMIWGLVAHLIADWLLQNEWMALNKMKRRTRLKFPGSPPDMRTPDEVPGPWWDRHPAAFVHAGIHCVLLALVFGWIAVPLALVHLVIDTRVPVEWWSRLIRQTQPGGWHVPILRTGVLQRRAEQDLAMDAPAELLRLRATTPLYDIGTEVRFWTDQVFHIAMIAVAALIVGLV